MTSGRWLQFQHRLEAVDPDWVWGDSARAAMYTNLSPGTWTFRVRARHPGGPWGEPASLSIVVPPRFYETLWFRSTTVVLVAAALLSLYLYRRRAWLARRQAELAELEGQVLRERARRLALRAVSAQEDERKRIAGELHDDINQRLALLSLELQGMPDGAAEQVESVREILRDVQRLSRELHPARLTHLGLAVALRGLIRQMQERAPFEIDLEVAGEFRDLSDDRKLCLYRITQEALQNATRHSQATHVSVHLAETDDATHLRIRDDGVGFDASRHAGDGLGIPGMEERAEAQGGALEIHAAPGVGTRIEATLPHEPRSTL